MRQADRWGILLATAALALASNALAQVTQLGKPPATPAPTIQPINPEEEAKKLNRSEMRKQARYQLDFDKIDIEKLLQTMSNITGRLFILPENIRGKISIIGPEKGKEGVSVDEAYAAFLASLDANGLCLYPSGKYLKVTEKRYCKQEPVSTLLDEGEPYTLNEQVVTKVFRLKYAELDTLNGVLKPFVTRDGDAVPYQPDLLIITDVGLNMHRLEKIIAKLDQPGIPNEIHIIRLRYAAATDVAEKLQKVFEEKQKKPGQRAGSAFASPVQAGRGSIVPPPPATGPSEGEREEQSFSLSQVIADERTQQLIIISSPAAFKRIMEVIDRLDIPSGEGGGVHVYYLRNSSAEDLASTLASLTTGITKGPKPAQGAARASTVADLFSGEVKITADKSTNSLVIVASEADYRNLLTVIDKLDRPRRQVFVEAVIMEVTLNNDLQLGFGLHGGGTAKIPNSDQPSSLIAGASEPGTVNSLQGVTSLVSLGGFLAGLQGPALPAINGISIPIPSFALLVHALQTASDVNVISTPHVLTSDNEDAEISVGQNVPFQAGIPPFNPSSLLPTTGTTSPTQNPALLTPFLGSFITPIQRQNVELKLKIKPQINESDFIKLTIDESTETIASTDPRLGPTTAKRAAKTVIVAKDQQTVVIGGLIQDSYNNSVDKTPLLGDIPILGWLFRDTDRKKTKTNLLLFLTPYIIRDSADFRRIFERKMQERQEFIEQFYGRQAGYEVQIDYAHKQGPLAKMLKTLQAEDQKLENGGPGAGGERAFTPQRAPRPELPPATPPPPPAEMPTPPQTPAPPPGGGAPPPPN